MGARVSHAPTKGVVRRLSLAKASSPSHAIPLAPRPRLPQISGVRSRQTTPRTHTADQGKQAFHGLALVHSWGCDTRDDQRIRRRDDTRAVLRFSRKCSGQTTQQTATAAPSEARVPVGIAAVRRDLVGLVVFIEIRRV